MKETEKMEVTREERELIEAIRNYNRAYPNGRIELLFYAQGLFDEMTNQRLTKALPARAGLAKQKGKDMETSIARETRITDMKKRLSDILIAVSWREIANTYFGRRSSWLYHKLDGIDGNGGQGGFTAEEAEQLQGALYDLSARIRKAADGIKAPATGTLND